MTQLGDAVILTELFNRVGDVVTMADASASGVPPSLIRRAADSGLLVRVAKSAFVRRKMLDRASEWEAFRLRAIGFGLCSGSNVHLTGFGAAAVLGVPTVHAPPRIVTGLRPGDAHRAPDRTLYGRTRWGHLPPRHRTRRSRVETVDAAYAVIDIARHNGAVAGLVAADHALHSGVHPEILARLVEEMENYPGIGTSNWVVEHGNARAESPLETLGRRAFLTYQREVPLSNVWFAVGPRRYRVDHYLPDDGIAIEGDGGTKYNDRPDAHQVVNAEKDRERDLRSVGVEFARYNYEVAMHRPMEILRRVDVAKRIRGNRPLPNCWSLDPPEDLRWARRA